MCSLSNFVFGNSSSQNSHSTSFSRVHGFIFKLVLWEKLWLMTGFACSASFWLISLTFSASTLARAFAFSAFSLASINSIWACSATLVELLMTFYASIFSFKANDLAFSASSLAFSASLVALSHSILAFAAISCCTFVSALASSARALALFWSLEIAIVLRFSSKHLHTRVLLGLVRVQELHLQQLLSHEINLQTACHLHN